MGVSAVTSSPSASETASQIVLTGQSPDRSYSMTLPSASGATRDRRAVDGGRRLLDELLGEHPHGVVVAVRLVHLERGELGVVLEVGALVAELAADLEDLLHAAHQQPLEVQLGGDPQVQVHVVGVDVRLERARVGTAVDQLQHRRLDLDEAAGVQRVADAAHHGGALVGDGRGRRAGR